jgi:parallel beta-helix repeat protein
MLRRCAAGALLVVLASCGGSHGPATVVAPSSPADTLGLVVSSNPADHPRFLCDGVEDDVEINAAIHSADSASHWTVILRPGTYHVHHGIAVLSNVTLRGAGPGTIIQLDDDAPPMISVAGIIRAKDDSQTGAGRRVHNVTIQDFVVDGNRAHQPATPDEKKFGFYAEGDFVTLRRLVSRNCSGYGFDAHANDDSIPTTNLVLEDCESFGNLTDGFTLDMVRNSTIQRNYSHDNDRHGFNLVTRSSDFTISSCRSVHNGGSGLMAQNGTHDIVVRACEFTNNGLQGIFLRDADGCSVLGNTLRDNSRSGLLLRLADHTTVTGNSLAESDTGSVGRSIVTLDSATVNEIATNTLVSSTAKQGVLESGTSDFNSVRGNVITLRPGAVHILLIGPHTTQSDNQLH